MNNSRYDNPQLFEAFVKSAQYIVRLKTPQDIWDHLGKFITTYFPAEWTALAERDPVNGISIQHSTLPAATAAQSMLTDAVRTVIADVLDSGFLAAQVVHTPAPSMTAFLPIVGEHLPEKVMLIGHKSAGPLPKELLNIYLAVAGLAGTTFERLNQEHELNKYRAHLEELVKERTAELEAANRELEAFSYSVSHDLRAPLRSIAGFGRVLLEDCSDKLDDAGKDALGRIRAATTRMGHIINDLLDLSRASSVEMERERVNLSDIAGKIAEGLGKNQPDRRVDFIIGKELYASCDERLLHLAIENLLNNAWKFTKNRERSVIEFGTVAPDETNPPLHPCLPDRQASQEGTIYYVRDNGVGFDMAYADRLFSPFQRLHNAEEYPGTGIGLATVQRIIQRHDGRIWAEGEVDKGAVFYFTLRQA